MNCEYRDVCQDFMCCTARSIMAKKELSIMEKALSLACDNLRNDDETFGLRVRTDGKSYEEHFLSQAKESQTVPKECYEEFGGDLDGCSRQESQGCGGCRCLLSQAKATVK